MVRKSLFGMVHIHSQQGVDHNPCYPSTKIGTVAEGSGSMESAVVRVFKAALHSAVFQIITVPSQNKGAILHCSHAYSTRCGP